MITRMLINNFQAHEKLQVNFDPEITCIVGPSDVGKSAIIRALRWVCTNQPGGDAFVRHGSGDASGGASVKLEVDGHTIRRRRSSGGETNEYILDDQTFKAFARDVPEPIKALLNMGPTSWQQQHDAPYWFSDSPGEVSRQLNTIVNLGIIDDTLSAVSKAVHSAKGRLEAAEEALTDAKRESKALTWVPEFDAALRDVEALEDARATTKAEAVTVANLLSKAVEYHSAQEIASRAATAAGIALDVGTEAIKLRREVDALARQITAIGDYEARAAVEVPTADKLIAAQADYKMAERDAGRLRNFIDDIREKEEILCQAEKKLKEAEKAVPPRCPTCGRSL